MPNSRQHIRQHHRIKFGPLVNHRSQPVSNADIPTVHCGAYVGTHFDVPNSNVIVGIPFRMIVFIVAGEADAGEVAGGVGCGGTGE